ncbi:hypothetical protein HPB48_019000 [Haemaphysalis longicornis]|uniref:Uncharacterized protein n=1 Tax=Haemaphysalis longicornis TaxID=44386 RepID=A0A9J6GBB5_HAELO|nr:hypothetical protein HPB48_019000 [Haemaphysalis longicornis]
MHHLAGLQCSFSKGRVSRFCLARHGELPTLLDIESCVERTPAVHKSHLEAYALDPAVNRPLYGIARASPLHGLSHFEVTQQLPPDAMHDILEGGVAYVLRCVLSGLVENSVLCKEDLSRITTFQYGFHDRKCAPVAIKDGFLTGKVPLKGTASQRWCLFRLLPQLFAATIPEGNPHWRVYLAYRQVVDIVLAEKIPRDSVPYLQLKVQQFLELYTQQYSSATVAPKLHYLLHYPKYILKFGPPRCFWGMRFEAKHSFFKNVASKAYELSRKTSYSIIETTGSQPLQLQDLPQEQDAITKVTPEVMLSSAKTATFQSCRFRIGDAFVHTLEDDIQLLRVERLVVGSTLTLLGQRLTTVCRGRASGVAGPTQQAPSNQEAMDADESTVNPSSSPPGRCGNNVLSVPSLATLWTHESRHSVSFEKRLGPTRHRRETSTEGEACRQRMRPPVGDRLRGRRSDIRAHAALPVVVEFLTQALAVGVPDGPAPALGPSVVPAHQPSGKGAVGVTLTSLEKRTYVGVLGQIELPSAQYLEHRGAASCASSIALAPRPLLAESPAGGSDSAAMCGVCTLKAIAQ